MSDRTTLRVLVLDGLDWEWCAGHRDLCPELWTIAQEGCCAPLRSCSVPITPTGVAALLTGREVDVEWVARTGGNLYASSQNVIRAGPWFRALAQEGMTIGLVNVPLTWPPFPVPRGSYLVSGFPVDEVALTDAQRGMCYPTGLDLLSYPSAAIVCDHGPGGTRDLDGLCRAEVEIADWVLAQERRDVEIVWIRATDGAGHHLWGLDGYAHVVAHASRVAARLRDRTDNLLVISDHGMDALSGPRCEVYRGTAHGPAAAAAGLLGGHAMDGVLFAAGDRVHARGPLAEQRLPEVAGGMFDLLQVPPAPGMISVGPAWSSPCTADEADRIRRRLEGLGYA